VDDSPPPESLKPMAADANPSFEVSTIKPSNPDQQGVSLGHNGRHFHTENTSLNYLIASAYGLQRKQIVGVSAWAETDKYDIEAISAPEGVPNFRQENLMIQKLLAERFRLVFHYEKRELSVYSLVPETTAPKLTKSESDPSSGPDFSFPGIGALIVTNATMSEFVQMLQSTILDRPVIDRTGFTQRYNFTLAWAPDESQFTRSGIVVPTSTASANASPNLFTAVREQIGMKLEITKALVEVLVIDHVEKPSAN
jgi:uncharacterized protein (TIGR03435 family)